MRFMKGMLRDKDLGGFSNVLIDPGSVSLARNQSRPALPGKPPAQLISAL